MLILSLAMALSPIVIPPEELAPVIGDLSSVLCGEFDPIAVGDACVATLVSAEGDAFGLVADMESFSDEEYAALNALRSARVRIGKTEIERIEDPQTLEVLGTVWPAAIPFYRWTGRWHVVE